LLLPASKRSVHFCHYLDICNFAETHVPTRCRFHRHRSLKSIHLNITQKMKHSGDTVSKPVVGREAEALSQAIRTGGYLANKQAWATIRRITEQIKNEKANALK